ncbi:ATPase, T2SS/T4P/T4SS family [Maridesulfovibrio hydrothermalis]|uniref:Type II secretion system protein E n=1 Tax=Maridesulfovibrio hydrothermalis AM13 = DSM 14728 TaxID=1121451 RepID=L0RB67_9BACT|nr:ATPase, T2SS/T4P/T4SS family [Maridesulfovibrio hydrothermalis]CCO24028.1 Type II secretion system protein E [Maridesulfovibrio hydrothermalis AM13 = DSM 14728]
MALKSVSFTDLILHENGEAFMKGCDSCGQKLVHCKDDIKKEIEILHGDVLRVHEESGRHTFRVMHEDIGYRVALYEGVDWGSGKVFFLRKIQEKVESFTKIGMPEGLSKWLLDEKQSKGLVLFTGAQASGKTYSASSLVATRLSTLGGHAVSFENPAEMPLDGKHGEFGFCFQAEIEREEDLAESIERSHRLASPNIIYIGEIRSKHAASEALRVSLGSDRQIVVATLHGFDLVAALERLITMAREIDGDVASQNLAQGLLAVVHQQLDQDENGKKVLHVPQFLLVPFNENYKGVRAKIQNGELAGLQEEMREQKNRIQFAGMGAI